MKELKISKDKLLQIIQVGLPAGIQGAVFSISNVLIQSSINSFGSIAVAGNTAASNIEGFVYTSMNALYQASLSFTSQNIGAKKLNRIVPILLRCLGTVAVVGVGLSAIIVLLGNTLLGIYSSEPEVIQFGIGRISVVCVTYFLCGMMDVACGSIRGMGYSVIPTLVSLGGACGLRILWIYTIFAANRTLFTLYLSYPITWELPFCVIWRVSSYSTENGGKRKHSGTENPSLKSINPPCHKFSIFDSGGIIQNHLNKPSGIETAYFLCGI